MKFKRRNFKEILNIKDQCPFCDLFPSTIHGFKNMMNDHVSLLCYQDSLF